MCNILIVKKYKINLKIYLNLLKNNVSRETFSQKDKNNCKKSKNAHLKPFFNI